MRGSPPQKFQFNWGAASHQDFSGLPGDPNVPLS